jgi:CCR4-NOT transcription complex subunit 6
VENILVDFRQIGMQRHAIKSEDLFNRVAHRDHIGVVCLFEHRDTGSRLIVANTHLFWDPTYRDVKLVQVALMLEELERIAHNFARLPPRPPRADGAGPAARAPPTYADGSKIPLVLAIDANSSAESGVYELLSSGKVEPTHADFMTQLYGAYTTEGIRHRLGLKSAYAATGELPMTNYTSNFKGVLDYVFYSTQNLAVTAVLGEVDKGYLDKVVGFPNAHFPSE